MSPFDLLFVHPSTSTTGVYQALAPWHTATAPPLRAAMLAEAARRQGRSVAVLDCNAEGLTPVEAARKILADPPRICHIVAAGHQPSASTQTMPFVIELCRAIRELNVSSRPPLQIHVSGVHPAALSNRTRQETSADVVVEAPPGDLVRAAYDLLPMASYRAHNHHAFTGPKTPYGVLVASVGCPFRCDFCCVSGSRHAYQIKPVSQVLSELDELVQVYGCRTIRFDDEMFGLKADWLLDLCHGLAKAPYAKYLNLWAYARVDTIRAAALPIMREAGFRWICLGIESAVERVRKGVRKDQYSTYDVLGIVRLIEAAGIEVQANFMFGLPDDDLDTLDQTYRFAVELNTPFPNFYCVMPYPGSELYKKIAQDHPEQLPENVMGTWAAYSQHGYEACPIPTKHLTAAEVLAFRDEAFRRYFSREEYLQMLGRKFGRQSVEAVQTLLKARLRRKLLEKAIP